METSPPTKLELKLNFGLISDGFAEQIKAHGLLTTQRKTDEFDGVKKAINDLYIEGYINEKTRQKAFGKLFTKIKQHIKIQNK